MYLSIKKDSPLWKGWLCVNYTLLIIVLSETDVIFDDVKNQSVHVIQNEECINKKYSVALLNNLEYVNLSDKSIKLFNLLKCCLGDNTDFLFEYEDIMARMQEIVE